MSNIDKQALRLRKFAKKATQGEWCAYVDSGTGTYAIHTPDDESYVNIVNWPGFDCRENAKANAEFIAEFNPKVAQALLDELEAAEKRNVELSMLLEGADAIQTDYAEALECQDDNDSVLAAIVALKQRAESAEKHIAELEARTLSQAANDVLAERSRQVTAEGWTPEHDDEHCNGELAMAAVCYINETGTVNRNGGKPWGWPWDASWWKPNTRRRNLVKATALLLAEIERIGRAAGIGKGE
ncbi:TPA: ead/Ea22-like family protein [Salmonella enterica]|nr:ead/Ea22-like family protein [Salmonella enterica]